MVHSYLASSRLGFLFLDLNFNYFTRMLNDFGDVGLVLPANLSRYPFYQVYESSVHPILPENTGTRTKRCCICFNHAESSVDGPENKEQNEEMVGEPEAFIIGSSKLSHGRGNDEHQNDKHDVPRPSRTSGKVGKKESFES